MFEKYITAPQKPLTDSLIKEERIEYLDSVRGLASFSVVIYHFIHCLDIFKYWEGSNTSHYLSMVFNGADAVSLFFVLSGFVLSYRYFKNRNEPVTINYDKYLVQRFFRLYPAFIFVLTIMYLYRWREFFSMHFFTDALINHNFNFIKEALLVKGYNPVITPGWTLGVEVVLSLLVPLLVIGVLKARRMMFWLLPFTILMGGFVSGFLLHFLLGILLAYYYPEIKNYNFKTSKVYPYRWLLYFVVIVFYSVRHIHEISPMGAYYYLPQRYIGLDLFHITGVASFCMLAIIINNKGLQKILLWKPFLFLGKISYSLYLIHWFLIFSFFTPKPDAIAKLLFMPNNAFIAGGIFCIGGSLISAVILYYLVEKPSHEWGKKLAAKIVSDKRAVTVS